MLGGGEQGTSSGEQPSREGGGESGSRQRQRCKASQELEAGKPGASSALWLMARLGASKLP